MKVVILAGGFGSRLTEETINKPKPMVEIGGMPILWHIMKTYSFYGLKDFIICLGYKGDLIKKFFLNYSNFISDLEIDTNNGKIKHLSQNKDNWNIKLIDTGSNVMTGGRLKRVSNYLDETFCLTYGDGVADIKIDKLLDFHKKQKKLVTISAVRPTPRFGGLRIKDSEVTRFSEKSKMNEGWINGGFFVMEPSFLKYLDDDNTVLEEKPLEQITIENQLVAYKHEGFWQCMDTLREKNLLEHLWNEKKAPWKIWG